MSATSMSSKHYTTRFEEDDDGWWQVACLCGWATGPFPGADDAADAYGDHRNDVGYTEGLAFGASNGT